MAEPGPPGIRADLQLGPLGYGAANVGNLYRAMTDDDAWAVLDAAWQSGIRYFDTAPHYGLGLSERRLGAFLASKPRGDYVLSTKVGRLLRPSPETADRLDDADHFAVPASLRRVWDFTEEGIRSSLEESLERLGLDAVDILYLHDPEECDLQGALASAVPALVALREEGHVAAVGVGSKSTEALLAGVRTGALDLVMVAGRYTLVEQPALDSVIPECRAAGVGVVAAAVFNSGLLASPRPAADARYEYGDVPAEILQRTRRIEEVCAEYGVALPVAALQFPLQEPVVRCVVVGGAEPGHVRENAERVRAEVPDSLWVRLATEGLVRR
jgi:D-threo-aldose 1-dehydrogenase